MSRRLRGQRGPLGGFVAQGAAILPERPNNRANAAALAPHEVRVAHAARKRFAAEWNIPVSRIFLEDMLL